jgi:hypothetical protein|tara:strand:+ start:4789 stop:4932 length:144 start_codon:yes stop_codon:yes gene_type:complete
MSNLEIVGLILITPLVIVVVAASMIKSEARRIEKMKARADKKKGRRS